MVDFSSKLIKRPKIGYRTLYDSNLVIHCHHYNARIQKTIESSENFDGSAIFRNAAEYSCLKLIEKAVDGVDDIQKKLTIISDLYSFLGYGNLDFSDIQNGNVTSDSSHFVEGWRCSFLNNDGPVCRFTEGYIQAAYYACFGKLAESKETQCLYQDHPHCHFSVIHSPDRKSIQFNENPTNVQRNKLPPQGIGFGNIDKDKVIEGIFSMPIEGNETGLIPIFNVYLANTPEDFYNLVSLQFIKKMEELDMNDQAKYLLEEDAEYCGLNTFSGIINSTEWEGLIKPMVKDQSDNLYGIIAIMNALGWGTASIIEHTPNLFLKLCTTNGYESMGSLKFKGIADLPECPMLAGVCSGIMALIYGHGELEERAFNFSTIEKKCISRGDEYCEFHTQPSDENE